MHFDYLIDEFTIALVPAFFAGFAASEFCGWAGVIGFGGLVYCKAVAFLHR